MPPTTTLANGESASTLTLLANTLILNNGAILRRRHPVEGAAGTIAEQDATLIGFNKAVGHDPISDTDAEGYGGGIELIGPTRNGLGVLYDNSAL